MIPKSAPDTNKLNNLHVISWILISALTTCALLAITGKIIRVITPIPLLWILPMATYLLSFIIAFSGVKWYVRQFHVLLLLAAIITSFNLAGINASVAIKIGVLLFTLLIFTLVGHTELYDLRPPAANLPHFYLAIAFGGALGALLIGLMAPMVFSDFSEFPITLILGSIGTIIIFWRLSVSGLQKGQFIALSAAVTLSLGYAYITSLRTNPTPAVTIVDKQRNFYGATQVIDMRVADDITERQLYNGSTVHGSQIISASPETHPTKYYTEDSAIGMLLTDHPKRAKRVPLRVGVIGLGVGTLGAYCKDGDYMRFYEINPAVITISQTFYTFLSFCKSRHATIEIVPGDARISLQQERDTGNLQKFDVLVVDAFTDDTIPTHLLTIEAIQLYLAHLSPDGTIAFHISNRYIDLNPVIVRAADTLRLPVYSYNSPGAYWTIITHDPLWFGVAETIEHTTPVRLWTDNYSSILPLLKK